MAFTDVYRRQVELLVRTIPHVAEEECFALKGGSAINLFYRDMPRLSIDIDLTYLPIAERDPSLAEIDAALKRIAAKLRSADPGNTITESAPGTQSTINKLNVSTPNLVRIKVEVTPVFRGCVYEPETMSVSDKVEDEFGFAETAVVSFADLYAGKIMAALNRQHPRDLFDVHDLLENEIITDELRTALIVYLMAHDHPPHKLLSSTCRNIAHDYDHNFYGMTETDMPIATLYAVHADLVRNVVANMTEDHKRFLLSFYRRTPEWERLGADGAQELPAIKWREQNLDNAGEETRADIVQNLEKVLW